MEWSGEAIAIGTRRLGETDAILEVMTRDKGRWLGMVRGARSRRLRPVVQPGNTLSVTWRARLDEHLGNFRVEPIAERAGTLMASGSAIFGLQLLGEYLRLIPERDPHPRLYEALALLVEYLDDIPLAAELMARFELLLLDEMGFGLDLSECAATGATEDLGYVSPKSGRAVSHDAGRAYHDRLLPLPAFLVEARRDAAPDLEAVADALRLTAFFLERHLFAPRSLSLPDVRSSFERAVLAKPQR
ncbi:DNA replication and repair protein RecO [Faunimonas pinastri]|uniref:DNA repair protein RecO n=1 Tax=Faunimonas pinastri TaxID=1855383 RepID=A0A1H9KTY2_9HYPH|nr:DNA repair protein RecO [Faunimonas pinastri]SER02642.1 DNA replication and repair protein RecO [Faunimonas pinastri]